MTASQLTKQIINYCNLKGHYVFRCNNIPGMKYRKNNIHRGIADIMGCTKQGIALAIEIKTTDQQSEFQKEFEEHYKKRGGIYILAHKLEDVMEVI